MRSQQNRQNVVKSPRPSFIRRRPALTVVVGCTLLACALSLGGPYRPTEPLPPGILDMHCHVAGIGAGGSGCLVSTRLQRSWRFGVYLRSFGVSRRELQQQGDQLVPERISQSLSHSRFVSQAVLLALDGVVGQDGLLDTNRTEVYVPNEFVAEAAAAHTNLLFGASVNPYRNDALDRLVWAKQHGAVLVKWIPSIMDVDPADPRLVPYYEKLVQLELPLLTHSGQERSFSVARDALCDPEKLRLPLSLGVRVIAAHIASTGTYQGERSSVRLARLMATYTNLYSDISSLTQVNKLRYMKEALTTPAFSGRLLYGSDYPLIHTPSVSPWFYLTRIPLRQIVSISATSNPWDADVRLKQALGTPADVFARPRQLLAR